MQQKGLGAAKFQREVDPQEAHDCWNYNSGDIWTESFANHRTQSSWELLQWPRLYWCSNQVLVDNRDAVIPWYHQNLQNHTPHLPETWRKSNPTLENTFPSLTAEKTNRFFSTDPGKPAPDPSVELHTHHPCGLWAHTKPLHPRPDRWLQGGLCICSKTSNENISLRNHSSTEWVGRTFPARKNPSSAIAHAISRCCCKDLCLQKE